MVTRAQEILFSTTDNVHSTHMNAENQVAMELVSPITLWTIWKQRCRRVLSNQTVHKATLLREIWSEAVATRKSQYDGITGGSKGAGRQRLTFIQ